ncbi:methyl-accepting chemotaxis protein [Symbiobacterium thermophilum]|uniref:methyl-accepting chemotaxis protein n=1 Tax=Symbiobacterium thermophilum TaxID=2734 RepID=UPI0035C76F0D
MKRNIPVTQVERDYPAEERLISETDLRGIITTANASFCAVAGYSREELVGKPHNIVRHPDMPSAAFKDMWDTIQAGERWVGIVKNRCKNGDHYWVKAFVSPVLEDGKIIGYRSVRRKPTREEIREAEELYRRMNSGEQGLLDTLGALRRRESLGERLGTLGQVALMLAWPAAVAIAMAVAATVGLPPAVLWAIAGMGGIVGAGLGVAIYRWQTAPLEALARVATAFERGDLTARIDLPGRSRYAQIARSINLALDGVEIALADTSQMLDGLRRGEFGRRITVTLPGEMGLIKESANRLAEEIEATITALNAQLAALADGQLDAHQRAFTGEGHFREAQERAAGTAARLATLLKEMVASVQALARGDLTRTLSFDAKGDLAILIKQYNAALTALSDTLTALQHHAHQVAFAAEENSRAAAQIAAGAEDQMITVEEVTRAVQESGASMVSLADDAEAASGKSSATVEIVRSSRAAMEQMVSIVQAIAASSQQISKFTNVIEEIAAQTNLLSLNAAIEAARAGEHGRGFAVVAQEVGHLAASSGKSAKEIHLLVQQAVEEARRAAESVAAVSGEMDRIEQAALESHELLSRIAAAIEEQGATMQQIGEHARRLSSIAESNAAATEELAASASELAGIAEAASAEVGRFRLLVHATAENGAPDRSVAQG